MSMSKKVAQVVVEMLQAAGVKAGEDFEMIGDNFI
jgi:hypothetical protein